MSGSGGVVLVGGAGFIGRRLAARLAAEGVPLTILDRAEAPGLPGVRMVRGELGDAALLGESLSPGATVIHLAWSTLPATSNADPAADAADNLLGSLRLLEACRARGVARVIFLSSGGTVYGPAATLPIPETAPTQPACAYGVSKLAVEKYLALYRRLHGLEGVVLRPANAYGPGQDPGRGQSALTVFTHLAARGEPITIWGDGSAVRDYLHVADLVEGVAAVLRLPPTKGEAPPVFNLGTGRGTSLRELVEIIGEALGRRPAVRFTTGRPLDVPANVLDSTRLREATGWTPRIAVAAGVREMLAAWGQGEISPSGGRRCG